MWWGQRWVQREANKRAKREVAKAKESAYKDLYDKLDLIEGQKTIYKLSKTRERRARDLTDIAYIKDSNGTNLTDEDDINPRWNEIIRYPTEFRKWNGRAGAHRPTANTSTIGKWHWDKETPVKDGKKQTRWPDNLPIEEIMVVAELRRELLTYILLTNNGKWYPR